MPNYFLGASLVPPWCLPGAYLVPPWCLPGASLHPLTWSQGLFWTPKTAEDCHSEPTCSQLGCIWDQLGPPPGQLKSTWGHFRPTYVPLAVDMGNFKPNCDKRYIKNHCFSIGFFNVFDMLALIQSRCQLATT